MWDQDSVIVGSAIRDGITIEALMLHTMVDALDELLAMPERATVLVKPRPDAAEEYLKLGGGWRLGMRGLVQVFAEVGMRLGLNADAW